MSKVLVVEAAESTAKPLCALLEQHEFTVDLVAESAEASALDLTKYAALVIDLTLGDDGALALLERLHRDKSHLVGRVVVMTSALEEEIVMALEAIGVCDVVPKPLNAEEIVRAVLECLEHSPSFSVQ
ncbi:MAG: Response regulator receiver domain [Acidobacteriota bacterium]|jgi:DNA-binding response OmpR family regulator|nr:Response regulator receiver domain [Acidobacteriota bacterium]